MRGILQLGAGNPKRKAREVNHRTRGQPGSGWTLTPAVPSVCRPTGGQPQKFA